MCKRVHDSRIGGQVPLNVIERGFALVGEKPLKGDIGKDRAPVRGDDELRFRHGIERCGENIEPGRERGVCPQSGKAKCSERGEADRRERRRVDRGAGENLDETEGSQNRCANRDDRDRPRGPSDPSDKLERKLGKSVTVDATSRFAKLWCGPRRFNLARHNSRPWRLLNGPTLSQVNDNVQRLVNIPATIAELIWRSPD